MHVRVNEKNEYKPLELPSVHVMDTDAFNNVRRKWKEWITSAPTMVKYASLIPDLLRMVEVFDVKSGRWTSPRNLVDVDPDLQKSYEVANVALFNELVAQCETQGRSDERQTSFNKQPCKSIKRARKAATNAWRSMHLWI